jgi:cysteine desulfurase
MLSYSAHKYYGPAGIGALYVRQKPPVPINRVMTGGAQQRLRPGSVPLALAAGFGAASDIANTALQTHIPRIAALTALLEQLLRHEITGLEINGGGPRLPGILNLRLPGISAQDVMTATAADLAMSSGAACASARRAPSAVLQAIGLSAQQIDCCLRLTIGRGTTEEEIRFTARCLGDAVRKLARSAV